MNHFHSINIATTLIIAVAAIAIIIIITITTIAMVLTHVVVVVAAVIITPYLCGGYLNNKVGVPTSLLFREKISHLITNNIRLMDLLYAAEMLQNHNNKKKKKKKSS